MLVFNKRDIGYTVISRFEESVREHIAYILEAKYESFIEGIPSGIIKKIEVSNFEEDSCYYFLEHTNLIDLMEIALYRDNYNSLFPNALIAKNEFSHLFQKIYTTRCKIAHIRGPFGFSDLYEMIEQIEKICNLFGVKANSVIEFIQLLNKQPEAVKVEKVPSWFFEEANLYSVPNNLPVPDYEIEGGFVGRNKFIKEIRRLLELDTHRVITISGAGGVGKSALALKCVTNLLEEKPDFFNGVVWLSAKEDRLTPLGIEELVEPPVKTYEELIDTILLVMGFPSPARSQEEKLVELDALLSMCEKRLLLIIDNLETITDKDIINFILDSHKNLKIFITSRKGLGQVERRCELIQLEPTEAVHLFRTIAKEKNISGLASLDPETIDKYVQKVFYFPLAIKWLVGQAALGKNLNDCLNKISSTTSDISQFCFEEIYNSLSKIAKHIVCAISELEDSPTTGILNYIIDIQKDDLEDALQELILVSFVIPVLNKSEAGDVETKFMLLPLTKGYVRNQLERDKPLKTHILSRIHSLEVVTEQSTKAKQLYKYSLTNMGATSREEQIAAVYANTAFQQYQAGKYNEAVGLYSKALEIAPDFSSVYRNWAIMESKERNYIAAEDLIKKAAHLNAGDAQIWQIWGNINLKNNCFADAIVKYKMALELSPDDPVLFNCLGQAHNRSGNYEEANKYFHLAVDADVKYQRHSIINLTSLSDNYQRWAEGLVKGRNHEKAKEYFQESLSYCLQALELDENDSKTNGLYMKLLYKIGEFCRLRNNSKEASYYFENLIKLPVKHPAVFYHWAQASCRLAEIALNDKKKERVLSLLSGSNFENYRNTLPPWLNDRIETLIASAKKLVQPVRGIIVRNNSQRKFTIIKKADDGQTTFLGHYNNFVSVISANQSDDLLVGKEVTFVPISNTEFNKNRADYIEFI